MPRTATVTRKTAETDIVLSIDLDGAGKADIQTGLGFFDHMLTLLAGHSLIDLSVRCQGDLHVDGHHTVEDVGRALGTALKDSLGDRRGIRRYGHAIIPMDESLATVAVDLGGRTATVFAVDFPVATIGAFDASSSRSSGRASRRPQARTSMPSCTTAATAITSPKRSSRPPPAPSAWPSKSTRASVACRARRARSRRTDGV